MPPNLTWQPTVVASSLVFPGTRQVSRYALKKKSPPVKTPPPAVTRPPAVSENREPAQRPKKKKTKSPSLPVLPTCPEEPSIAPAEPLSQTTQPESDPYSGPASLEPSSPAVSPSSSDEEVESASSPPSPASAPCEPAVSPASSPGLPPSPDVGAVLVAEKAVAVSEHAYSPPLSSPPSASPLQQLSSVSSSSSAESDPDETVVGSDPGPQLEEAATEAPVPAAAPDDAAGAVVAEPQAFPKQLVGEEETCVKLEPEAAPVAEVEARTSGARRRREKPKAEVCEWLSEGLWSLFAGSRSDATLQAVLGRLRGVEFRSLMCSPEKALRASDEMQYAVQTREGQGEVYEVLRRALEPLGWRQTSDGETWNLLWTWQQPVVDFKQLLSVQKVNHFRENKHLTRKDYLKRSQDRYIRFSKSNYFRIYPETYILPKDYSRLIEAFAEKPEILYIMKPVGSSRGRGVKLISELSEISYSSACIVQRYIERPVLYKGFKFDLRIYVLVTSFAPLQAYIYKQGFARLATVQYSLEEEALKNKLVHVTNVAVQMHAAQDKNLGTKLTLDQLKYSGCFGPADVFDQVVWPRIKEAAIKALVFASHNVPPNPNSFELFGFDMLVERDSLRVWVLEVNSSPSMSLDTPVDQAVKVQLIRDTVLLVDPIQFDRNVLEDLIDRRRNSRIDRNAKLSLADADKLFLGKAYATSFPDSCEPGARRLGDFEVIAPSELYSKVAHEARNVVNPS